MQGDGAPDTLFGYDADNFPGAGGFPPTGWTTQTAGGGANTWYQSTAHDGACASVDDGPLNSTHQDEWLITPTIDCSTITSTHLTFWDYFYRSTASGDSTAQVLGSTDDGATWTQTIASWMLTDPSGNHDFDISAWADGQSQVKIAFRFNSSATTPDYDYWDVDDIWVGSIDETIVCWQDFEEMIPGTGFPPPGWSEVIYSGTGTWTAETGPNPPPPPTYDGLFACADDDGAGSAVIMVTGLFTPSLDVSGIGAQQVNVAFSSHYNNIGSDYCAVRTYSNAALEATVVTYTADHDMEESLWFDPSGYVDPTDVQVEFYYNDGGTWAWEWSIDNVLISAGTPPPPLMNEVGGDDENDPGFQLNNPGFQGGNQGSLQNQLGFAKKK